jgi:stearoyl-CoA desaturase (delta-9 desaturase)
VTTQEVRKYRKNEKRPWSEFRPVMFLSIVGMHLLAATGIIWHVVGGFWPSAAVLWTAAVMYVIAGFGIAIGYHRLFTHEGYECGPVLRAVLAFSGALAAEGPPDTWLRTHKRHHVYADRPGDAHSPFQYGGSKWLALKGILWSHIGWLFYVYKLPARARPDALDKDKLLQSISRHYSVILLITFLLPAAVCGADGLAQSGWHGLLIGALDGFLIAGMFRVVFFLNITWCINSVSHLWGELVAVHVITRNGTDINRTYFPSDGSRNSFWWLKWLSFGEANHALHHLFRTVAFHGWGKWAIDPSKWLLIVLERLGLVWNIKRPPEHELVRVEVAAQIHLPENTFVPIGRLVSMTPSLEASSL